MIDKDKTLTVGTLLAMLADGRITRDTPIAIFNPGPDTLVGLIALELLTFDDGARAVTLYPGQPCAKLNDIVSSSEVFPG